MGIRCIYIPMVEGKENRRGRRYTRQYCIPAHSIRVPRGSASPRGVPHCTALHCSTYYRHSPQSSWLLFSSEGGLFEIVGEVWSGLTGAVWGD